jgi:CheY-like chemotaxis protein
MFSQESKDITRKYGGSGLGLSITRRLLELMNSKIEVHSEKGVGSVFSFVLNLHKASTGLFHERSTRAGKDLEGTRVLMVEDNQMNILLASKFFKRWNVDLVITMNGKDAIQKIKSEPFDLILMDLHMPEMDGYEATAEIRKFNSSIPIFALTADAFIETKSKALSSGMNDFITKPFKPEELYNKILKIRSKSTIS